MMTTLFNNVYLSLMSKNETEIKNHAVYWFAVLFAILYFGYAFYCTSRGYNFYGISHFFRGGVVLGCWR